MYGWKGPQVKPSVLRQHKVNFVHVRCGGCLRIHHPALTFYQEWLSNPAALYMIRLKTRTKACCWRVAQLTSIWASCYPEAFMLIHAQWAYVSSVSELQFAKIRMFSFPLGDSYCKSSWCTGPANAAVADISVFLFCSFVKVTQAHTGTAHIVWA